MMSHRPRRVEPLHQHLERHVLMLVGSQTALTHLLHHLSPSGITLQIHPQHHRVDEEPHQLIQCRVITPGDREAHRHIRTGTELAQQHRQRSLHHHETGRIVLPSHPRHPRLQLRRPLHGHTGPTKIGHRRIRPIRRQLQPLGQPGQHLLPMSHLPRDHTVGISQLTQMLTLPQRVIHVLHRQRRPPRNMPHTPGGIGHPHITSQRRHRSTVGSDVMHHRHQHVLTLTKPEKRCPQRNLNRQVEAVTDGGADGLLQSGPRPTDRIDHLPPEVGIGGRHHHLPGHPLDRSEHRPQALVTGHHISQRLAKRAGIEGPAQPQSHRHVVNRRRTVQLAQEPQPLLGKRQRHHHRPLPRRQRRAGRTPLIPARVVRQARDSRRVEHRTHGQLDVQPGIDRRDQPNGRKGITAQVEEGVVDPDPLQPQHLSIDTGQDLLGRRARGPIAIHLDVLRGR